MAKIIRVSRENHARLLKIKQDLRLKSIDAAMEQLLDAAEEAQRQGINLVEKEANRGKRS